MSYHAMPTRALLPLLLIPLLGGCINLGLGNAKVPPALLTLTPQARPVDGSTTSGQAQSALSVIEPESAAELAVVRVAVNVDASRVAYLKKAQWVERPARLFQHLLAETLRAQGKQLVTEGDRLTHGPILSGRLIDCGYDARSASAVVRFDAVRHNPDGTVDVRRFEASVPHIGARVEDVGPALNQAANQVAKAVADWIG
ncbi:ABC-type transport auxiliary lipoprotein family protein [Novosphingobium acidiphilum]|jgi:cholesterol transport system auxiliary component|uniref:ABC-type transport auxiliary lipoprotein family protein n=1 Tax=Novosphingobium acidiphilum TaxID=505248 RepID=UPI000429FEB9|nr:ABC-type transport auxiliary lipoprotein family protein [Novosphingobium acidiphilum]